MESLWNAILFAIAAAVLVAFWSSRCSNGKPMKLPPGPPTLPIIGNMHQLAKGGDVIHIALAKLAQVYGPLMTVWLGSWQPMVIVSDQELVWEVLVSKSQDFAARELPSLLRLILADFRTIVSSNAGPHWHSLRRGLPNSGLSPLSVSGQTQQMESDITKTINSMIEEASFNGGVVKPFAHIRRSSIRLLARLIFGPDFSDDSFDHDIDVVVEDAMEYSDATRLVDTFPPTRYIPSVKRYIVKTQELKQRIKNLIGRCLSSPPPPNSYAHFLLSQNLPEDVVIFSIFELFLLGVDSTGSTAMWALALLIHNQDAQQKLYQEIRDNSSGSGKGVVKVEELSKLPYLQAVAKETMRMKPIAPLAVPHKAAKDTVLNGTRVAEGTPVMVNLYALHYDPKVWNEPFRFIPERFLESSKQYHGKRGGLADQASFLPFGAGMRVCAGMDVGKLQLTFVVSNLVNAFHWSNGVHGKLPDLSEEVTFVLAMKNPLEARIVQRGL